METDDAAKALAEVQTARSAMADRLVTPWWYHPALGLLYAGLVLAWGLLDDGKARLLVAIPFFAGLAGLVVLYRRLTGVWVNGHEAGPAARWAWAMGILYGVVLLAAHFGGRAGLGAEVLIALSAAVVAATIVVGRRFDAAYRAHLRGRG
jgi:hypothetical protein